MDSAIYCILLSIIDGNWFSFIEIEIDPDDQAQALKCSFFLNCFLHRSLNLIALILMVRLRILPQIK